MHVFLKKLIALGHKAENKLPPSIKEHYDHHRILVLSVLVIGLFVCGYKLYHYVAIKLSMHTAPITVSVATALQKEVTVPFRAIGTVAAYQAVTIRAQTDGQIIEIPFKRGQTVTAGQMLFVIDPRPAQAQLQQAEATLAKDQAQLENAQLTTRRDKALIGKSFISQANYDQDKTNEAMQAAAVKADEAAIDNAKLQLAYSYIRSPVAGRAGDIAVDAGNIIKSAQYTALTTVNQLQPIYVNFSVPQSYLNIVLNVPKDSSLPVTLNHHGKLEKGVLSFVDNQVDTTTGTIALKATFANADLQLWPGQYVDVDLGTTHFDQALVVPSEAVQQGTEGAYVFILNDSQATKVSYRLVTTGPTVGDQTLILKGLKPGDRVVTAGQLQLTEGTLVRVAQS